MQIILQKKKIIGHSVEVVKADAISGKVFEWQLQHFSPHSNIKKKLNITSGEI